MGIRSDYAKLRQDSDTLSSITEKILQACEARDAPIEAIHRLMTPKRHLTISVLADRILQDWQAEQPKKSPVPFSAPVVYVQSEFEELKRRFPQHVESYCADQRFDPIDRCKEVSRKKREISFEYVNMGRAASTDEVLAEIERRGLRPALYEEFLGVLKKYSDAELNYPLVALGSEINVRGGRCVALMCSAANGRYFDLVWVGHKWLEHYWFLAVRKEEQEKP